MHYTFQSSSGVYKIDVLSTHTFPLLELFSSHVLGSHLCITVQQRSCKPAVHLSTTAHTTTLVIL